MKILHLVSYYQDSLGYQENWLPYYQMKQGHHVEISTSDRYFPFPSYEKSMKERMGDRQKSAGIFYDRGVKVVRHKTLFEVQSRAIVLFNFYRHLFKFRPDVIHLHGITNLNLIFLLPYLIVTRTKLFVDSHSDYQVVRYNSFSNKIYYFFWKSFYKIIDRLVKQYLPITAEGSLFLKQELSISPSKITINYLGADAESFHYSPEMEIATRKELGLGDEIVIINTGKQYSGKKIDYIIAFVKKLKALFPHSQFKLVLIGNGDEQYEDFLKPLLEELGDSLVRLPFVKNSDLIKYYSMADIGIWPGVPSNSIQEAMACNVALVLPKNETISQLISGNGFFIEEDLTSFAQKCGESFTVPEKLLEQQLNSRKLLEKYSWEQIARESIEIYENN